MTADLRDWQPGDGLQCSFSRMSPIPCSAPTKTSVSVSSSGPRTPDRIQRRPFCIGHAVGLLDRRMKPAAVRARAEAKALQQLAADHWDAYQSLTEKFLAEEQAAARALVVGESDLKGDVA